MAETPDHHSSPVGYLVPESQRRTLAELTDRLDLAAGDTRAKRSAFWMMLVLSAVIAISGVIGDSTATVIGAMIVAPLSIPILGIALGIVAARAALLLRSVLFVAAGVVIVVALGWLFAQLLPNPVGVLSNTQVSGRTSPKLMDLTAAVATGLVAAVAIVRRDVGDVLPGVAIAISLVPPLGVVGVCLGSGAPALALGAFVLFASNVVAMVITATIVLLLTGYQHDARAAGARRLHAYLVLAAALALITMPLIVNSLSTLWAEQIADAARVWLHDDPHAQVLDVTVHGRTATITILSTDPMPPLPALQSAVDDLVPWNLDLAVVHNVGGRIDHPD